MISKKRQSELRQDETVVRKLYDHAVQQSGQEAVDKDLSRLWDLRCKWGMLRKLPFGATTFKNLGEMLWIAENVCGYTNGRRK